MKQSAYMLFAELFLVGSVVQILLIGTGLLSYDIRGILVALYLAIVGGIFFGLARVRESRGRVQNSGRR